MPRTTTTLGLLAMGALVLVPPASTARTREEKTTVVVQGKPYELWRGWHENGRKWYEGYWRSQKQELTSREWSQSGVLVSEEEWREGKKQGRSRTWYPSGKLASDCSYQRDQLHGAFQSFHANGQPKIKTRYERALLDGTYESWHRNGTRWLTGRFEKGQATGPWTESNPGGKVVKRRQLVRGALASALAPGPALSYPGPLGAKDFALVIAEGGLTRQDLNLKIAADGGARHASHETVPVPCGQPACIQMQGRQADFQLTVEDQRAIRDRLRQIGFLALKASYVDPRVKDGTQWQVRLRLAGREKSVYCSNRFPAPLRELSRFVRRVILPHYELELLTARLTSEEVARDISFWP